MVTKGIIKTLDLTGNTCTVRLPLFETAGNDHIIGTATISNTPGSYNGYKEGDVVWVAFEDGSMNSPVVIGKLYLGVEEERKDPRGVLNVENSTVAKTASMPADTKLSVQTDHNIPNTTSPFGSLSSIANNLNALNTTVAQNDRDYGNKFKQVISSVDTLGDEYRSTLEQTDRNIRAEVMNKHNGEESGFGWNLTSEDWTVYQRFSGDDQIISDNSEIWVSSIEIVEQDPFTGKKDVIKSYYTINGVQTDREIKETDSVKPSAIYDETDDIWKWNDTNLAIKTINKEAINAKAKNIKKILVANEDGLTVAGTIEAEDGHIGKFIIGDEHSCTELENKIASGIYSEDYITKFEEEPGNTSGVYVGTDGIKLGSSFSVSSDGEVNATQATISGTIEAEDGHIGSFIIGEENAAGHSGIYSDDYKDKNNKSITSFKNGDEDWEFSEGAKGVYVGTDGIRLGSNFSVDNEGVVTAKGLRIDLTDDQKNELKGKTTLYYMYSSDGQNHPAENHKDWSETIPATPTGSTLETAPYLWTKTVTEYTWVIEGESKYTVSYNVSKVGVNTYSEIQYKLSTSSEDAEVYNDKWSTDIKVPTKTVPYVWTRTVTYYSDTNGVKSTGTASLYDSFDSLISILSVDGIDIISSTGTGTDKEYHLKADTLNGAVSDQVTIGGFSIGNTQLHAGAGSGAISLQTSSTDKGQLTYISAEYIESNGNQYIDTKVKYDPSKIYVVDIKISYNTVSPTNQICGFTANRGCGIGTAGNTWWLENGTINNNTTVAPNKIYDLKFVKGTDNNSEYFERWVDGTKVNAGVEGNTTITSNTFWLLATPEKTNDTFSYGCHSKLYSCQIYENGALIRNFKPALKNNKYGLYDSCTGEFFGNSGSGRLTGSLATETASSFTMSGVNYTRLDYIKNVVNESETDTKANYIEFPNLSFDKSTGLKLEMVVEPVADTSKVGSTESRCAFFSSYSSDNQDSSHISIELHTSGSTNNLTRLYVDGTDRVKPSNIPGAPGIISNKKNNLVVQVENGNGVLKINESTYIGNGFGTTGTWEGPFRIFVDNHGGGRFGVFTNPFKLYSVNIYNGTQLTAKLVPVLNEQTQTPGLINLLTGTFYPNAAGAKFEYGEYTTGGKTFVGSGNDSINTYRLLEYLESDGQPYIKPRLALDPSTDSFEVVVQSAGFQNGGILGRYAGGNSDTFMLYNYQDPSIPDGVVGVWASFDSAYNYLYSNCTAKDTKKHTFKYTPCTLYTDGNLVAQYETVTSSTAGEMYLFALNTSDGAAYKYRGRIYSCKIWQGTELKRDYIPVIQNEAEYGMYDLIEHKFYSNEGSGSFTGKGAAEEFTALYLGAPDAENAPFAVTNTGKLKATSGTIGGFTLKNNILESGSRGQEQSIALSSVGHYADMGTGGKNDWLLTVGQSFGVDASGKLHASAGVFNGQLSPAECYLNNVKEFNFNGELFQIGGMTLRNEVGNQGTTSIGTGTFTLISDESTSSFRSGASYIGSNTLYSLAFTCDKTLLENTTLDWRVINSSWLGYSNGYPIYNTIDFDQPLTFLSGTSTLKINAIGADRGLYGDWSLRFITIKNSSGQTQIIYPNQSFTNNIKTTSNTIINLLACSGGFIPESSGEGTLGTANNRWGDIFCANINSTGDATFSGDIKLDGKLSFKAPTYDWTYYYGPMVSLSKDSGSGQDFEGNAMTGDSPNCIWSVAVPISTTGWTSVALPWELYDPYGDLLENEYVVSVIATPHYPKGVTVTSTSKSGTSSQFVDVTPAQSVTFYTRWDGEYVYVYNPINLSGSNYPEVTKAAKISIVVFGKI